jgi:hypothetical protein
MQFTMRTNAVTKAETTNQLFAAAIDALQADSAVAMVARRATHVGGYVPLGGRLVYQVGRRVVGRRVVALRESC